MNNKLLLQNIPNIQRFSYDYSQVIQPDEFNTSILLHGDQQYITPLLDVRNFSSLRWSIDNTDSDDTLTAYLYNSMRDTEDDDQSANLQTTLNVDGGKLLDINIPVRNNYIKAEYQRLTSTSNANVNVNLSATQFMQFNNSQPVQNKIYNFSEANLTRATTDYELDVLNLKLHDNRLKTTVGDITSLSSNVIQCCWNFQGVDYGGQHMPLSNVNIYVKSTSNLDIGKVVGLNGIGNDPNNSFIEAVTIDGITPVQTLEKYLRVEKMSMSIDNVDSNVGDIYSYYLDGLTERVLEVIPSGDNISNTIKYYCPSDRVAIIKSIQIYGCTGNFQPIIYMDYYIGNSVPYKKLKLTLDDNQNFTKDLDINLRIAGTEEIVFRIDTLNQNVNQINTFTFSLKVYEFF